VRMGEEHVDAGLFEIAEVFHIVDVSEGIHFRPPTFISRD